MLCLHPVPQPRKHPSPEIRASDPLCFSLSKGISAVTLLLQEPAASAPNYKALHFGGQALAGFWGSAALPAPAPEEFQAHTCSRASLAAEPRPPARRRSIAHTCVCRARATTAARAMSWQIPCVPWPQLLLLQTQQHPSARAPFPSQRIKLPDLHLLFPSGTEISPESSGPDCQCCAATGSHLKV